MDPIDDPDFIDPDNLDDGQPGDAAQNQPKNDGSQLNDAIARKKYWRDKAVDPKTGKTYKSLLEEQQQAGASETEKRVASVDAKITDMQLAKQYNLDDQDLRVVKGLASGAGKQVAEILANKESDEYKTFETYQRGKTAKQVEDNAIPEPTSRVPVFGDKSFGELDTVDKKKNYTGAVDTLIKKARNTNRNLV